MSKIHSVEKVAYSSIVGQSIMLMNDAGACIGQLSVIGAENPQDIADQVVETFSAPNKHAYRVGRAQGRASLLTAIERAYGLLWRDTQPGEIKQLARKKLLGVIDKEGQRRGIKYATDKFGAVSDHEALRDFP